jgi:hypothetical protein
MKRLRPIVIPLGLLLLAAAVLLDAMRPREQAAWLRVEAPPHALVGQMLAVRVTLSEPAPDGWLVVDLHAMSTRREPLGFLSSSSPQPVAQTTRSYTFEAPVVAADDLGHVQAIVFLSPSGRWEDRLRFAATAAIPVESKRTTERLEPIPVYDRVEEVASLPAASPAMRASIAALWLLVGLVLCWTWIRPPAREARSTDSARHRSGWLALACAAAAVWELSNAETGLANHARAFAFEHRLYYERRTVQEWITVAVVMGTVALAAIRLRPSRDGRGLLPAALWLYAGISLTTLLSLHELDRLLAASVLSVPLVQVAKLAAALTGLIGAVRETGRCRSIRGLREDDAAVARVDLDGALEHPPIGHAGDDAVRARRER